MENVLPLDITAQQVSQLLNDNTDFLLLDCRQPDEFNLVHLASAKLLPMDELPNRIGELEVYRDKRIVVYCHLGMRSQLVADWLRAKGFGKVQNMSGGIDGWAQQIDPSLPRY